MNCQNLYVLLCIVIIYSCMMKNSYMFFVILSTTYFLVLVDEKNYIIKENQTFTSAKLSTDVTPNPRKNDETQKNDQVPQPFFVDPSTVKEADTERDKKISPYQHSYEQRKRLLETIYLELEQTNKWKKTNPSDSCQPIRSGNISKII